MVFSVLRLLCEVLEEVPPGTFRLQLPWGRLSLLQLQSIVGLLASIVVHFFVLPDIFLEDPQIGIMLGTYT